MQQTRTAPVRDPLQMWDYRLGDMFVLFLPNGEETELFMALLYRDVVRLASGDEWVTFQVFVGAKNSTGGKLWRMSDADLRDWERMGVIRLALRLSVPFESQEEART